MIFQQRDIAASALNQDHRYTVSVILVVLDEFDEEYFAVIPYSVVTDAPNPTVAAEVALEAAGEHAEFHSDKPGSMVLGWKRVVSTVEGTLTNICVDLDYDALETNCSRLPEIDHIFPREEVTNPKDWATEP